MKRIYLSPPDVGDEERAQLLAAFDSNWIAPVGPELNAFERDIAAYVGVPHAAALSSGTAALHLALVVADVSPGDRVITSSLTFAASANAVRYVRAEPVFIDSSADDWNMDPALLEETLAHDARHGQLPAAVLAVDLYGQCADFERIGAVCRRYGVPLIEDAAEALGARLGERPAGSLGDIAVLSFNGNKIITTSGGGMILSSNQQWIDRARYLSTQAREPVPHYEHREVGYNYRLSNLLAALGRAQLRRLDSFVARRREHFAYYRDALGDIAGVSFMPQPTGRRSTNWLTCLLLDPSEVEISPEEVCARLDAEGIEARRLWKPMHLQPVFADCTMVGGTVSETLFERGLCIPSGSALTDEERALVAARLRRILTGA